MLTNNNTGEKMLSEFGTQLVVYPVPISKILIRNTQLKEPAKHSEKRQKLLKRFKDNGYSSIEKFFKEHQSMRLIMQWFVFVVLMHLL